MVIIQNHGVYPVHLLPELIKELVTDAEGSLELAFEFLPPIFTCETVYSLASRVG